MEKDESPIMSTSVSLGMKQKTSNATPMTSTKPLNLLVMGDFGFQSTSPEKISASDWNDFCASHRFEFSCTVQQDTLPQGVLPFFLEYSVESLQDFSIQNVIEKAPVLNSYKKAQTIIDNLDRSSISVADAFDQISKLQIPEVLKMKLHQGLGISSARSTPSSNPLQIDSILSMIDLGDPQNTIGQPTTISDEVISEIATGNGTTINVKSLHEQIASQISQIASAIQNSVQFKMIATQWYALKSLLKIAGRDRSVQIFVASCPVEGSESGLQDFLGQLSETTGTPDVILWAYTYTSTTASLQTLEQVCTIADSYKTLLITSLDRKDGLTAHCNSTLPMRIIIAQESMIPLRRLRSNVASRACVLCVCNQGVSNEEELFKVADGAWLCTAQWISSLSVNQTPYHWPEQAEPLSGFSITSEFKHNRLTDVGSGGLTLAHNPAKGYIIAPVVLLDAGEESPYRSAGFNLLVNRTARLTAEWVSSNSSAEDTDAAAQALRNFLISELKPNHILSSDASLTIGVEQRTATVNIDSDVYINGFPVRFQFSVEI